MNQKKYLIANLITTLSQQLESIMDSASAQQHAWWLVQALTKLDRSQLIQEQTITLSDHQEQQLATWVDQLVHQHKPIAYIIGTVPFCGLELFVEPPILIPRPETEEWVDNLIEQLIESNINSLKILDVGTGTGCIALSIAKAFPSFSITATDINKNALNLAQKNGAHNQITTIRFVESDLFEQLGSEKFDLIISNPPYIGIEEKNELSASVLNWEDPTALFATDHGDAIIKKIILQAPNHLTNKITVKKLGIPQLVLEVGYQQAQRIKRLMLAQGYDSVTIIKDSFGNDRVVTGSLSDEVFPNK